MLIPGGPATALLTIAALAFVLAESCTTVSVGDAVEPATTCTGGAGIPGWLLLLGLLLAAAAPFVVGVVLYRRARARVRGSATEA